MEEDSRNSKISAEQVSPPISISTAGIKSSVLQSRGTFSTSLNIAATAIILLGLAGIARLGRW